MFQEKDESGAEHLLATFISSKFSFPGSVEREVSPPHPNGAKLWAEEAFNHGGGITIRSA